MPERPRALAQAVAVRVWLALVIGLLVTKVPTVKRPARPGAGSHPVLDPVSPP